MGCDARHDLSWRIQGLLNTDTMRPEYGPTFAPVCKRCLEPLQETKARKDSVHVDYCGKGTYMFAILCQSVLSSYQP